MIIPHLIVDSINFTIIWAKIIGFISGVGIIYLTGKISVKVISKERKYFLLPSLIVSSIPHFGYWSSAGLETSLYIFVILLAIYYYITDLTLDGSSSVTFYGIFFLLIALIRIDGVLLSVTVMIFDILRIAIKNNSLNEVKGTISHWIFFFVLPYFFYTLWRFFYFGSLIPFPLLAKGGSFPSSMIEHFIQNFTFFIYISPLIVLFIFYLLHTKTDFFHPMTITILTPFVLIFNGLQARVVLGVFRLLLPSLPLIIIVGTAGFLTIIRNSMKIQANIPLRKVNLIKNNISSSVIIFILFTSIFLYLASPVFSPLFTNFSRPINHDYLLIEKHGAIGKWISKYSHENVSIGLADVGIIPYISDLYVFDIHHEGLTSPNTIKNGFDIDYFLQQNISLYIFYIGIPRNITTSHRFFLEDSRFQHSYEYLFSLEDQKDHWLVLFKDKNVLLKDGWHNFPSNAVI